MISLISIANQANPQHRSYKKTHKSSKSNKQTFPVEDNLRQNSTQLNLSPPSPDKHINKQSLWSIDRFPQSQKFIHQKQIRETNLPSLLTTPKQQKNKKPFINLCCSNTKKTANSNQLTIQHIIPQPSTSTLLQLSQVAFEAEKDNPLEQSIVRASLKYFECVDESSLKQRDLLLKEQNEFQPNKTTKINLFIEEEEPFPISNIELSNQISNQQTLVNNQKVQIIQPKMKKIKLVTKYSAKLPMKQQFRYCIGCEDAVLEANIDYHSRTCSLYQKVFAYQIQSIVKYVKNKIESIKKQADELIAKLDQKDLEHIRKYSKILLQNGNKYLLNQEEFKHYLLEFEQVQKISKNWFSLFQLLQKIDWFVRLHKNIKNIYNI